MKVTKYQAAAVWAIASFMVLGLSAELYSWGLAIFGIGNICLNIFVTCNEFDKDREKARRQ